jgi:Lon protease-like protein
MALPFGSPEKQALLEAETLMLREDTLVALLEIEAASNEDDDPPSLQ